jgi:hypothetical protein
MLKAKIDVTKVKKEYLFEGKGGAKYLDLILFPNKDGASKYGDTHYIVQSIPKDEREKLQAKGERMPIIGNARPNSQTKQEPVDEGVSF